ncbi:MAG: aminoacyl-tRNA hydrolase [Planctomycetia bacterium]|nr:aminoacyl-tRNA hydrolase [Planctomycetia bacterium]
MKLVAGLGNPGRKYEKTRHNVGYDVVAEVARRHSAPAVKSDFFGRVTEVRIGRERVLLLRPDTFMNLSGKSVLAARDFFKLPDTDLLLVSDDFNLPLGKLRVRAGGSAGGHNGLEDVIRVLGHNDFARLRIGIGQPPERVAVTDFVLGKFSARDQTEIDVSVALAADAVEAWVERGTAECMNRFN